MKPLRWIASAKDDLSAMPTEVRRAVGYAQQGEKHDDAKVLKGFGHAAVLEVIAGTWRYVPRRLHRPLRRGGLCAARLPQEVEARHRNAEEGAGADPQTAEELAEQDHIQWSARGGHA